MAGNNIPFQPGDSSAYKKGTAPVQKFPGKHRGAPGNPNSPKNAGPYPNGNAHGKGQPNNQAVLQKAAGKRLFGGKPGAFAQEKYRDV